GWSSRLKYIPGLMSLVIGLGLNQAKAVLEGFFNDDKEFKRSPKLGVDANGKTMNKTAYKVPKSLITFLELGFAFYYLAAVVVSIEMHKWASVPFLVLFFNGFAYMSLFSLMDIQLFRRLAMDELEDGEQASHLVQ
ncbi:MAG TPA: glycosyl transferase family 2, partial [Holophagaceae bacterium]|nr:glycosyl transferase family 2 [Holophagaceae bacterium]